MARREHYLIDGYNVINAWPELKRLRGDLAAARDALLHMLLEYGAFEKYEMTIVFDAMFTEDEEHIEQMGLIRASSTRELERRRTAASSASPTRRRTGAVRSTSSRATAPSRALCSALAPAASLRWSSARTSCA